MWSSTLPTGTISDEKRAGRTFPRSTHESTNNQPRHAKSTASPTGRSQGVSRTEIERLRDENRQLRSQIKSLRSQGQCHQADKQAIVDRYEQVIAELEQAAATSSPKSTRLETAIKKRPSERGVVGRFADWL